MVVVIVILMLKLFPIFSFFQFCSRSAVYLFLFSFFFSLFILWFFFFLVCFGPLLLHLFLGGRCCGCMLEEGCCVAIADALCVFLFHLWGWFVMEERWWVVNSICD